MRYYYKADKKQTETNFFKGVKGQSNWRKDTVKQKHIGSDGYLVMPSKEENWFNRQNKHLRVTVMTHIDEGYGKYSFVYSQDGLTANKKTFKRKTNAMKYAKKWMKKHPRG